MILRKSRQANVFLADIYVIYTLHKRRPYSHLQLLDNHLMWCYKSVNLKAEMEEENTQRQELVNLKQGYRIIL